MSPISISKLLCRATNISISSSSSSSFSSSSSSSSSLHSRTPPSTTLGFSTLCPSPFEKLLPSCPLFLSSSSSSPAARKVVVFSNSSEEAEVSAMGDEWLQRLPDKKKPLYSHSLPCIDAWLKQLGFYQSKDDRAVWFIQKPDWHAMLSLDVTDLYIRYLKNGPGNLEKDVERRFSYALSREDIENAILGGP